jgi:hypothetical protein
MGEIAEQIRLKNKEFPETEPLNYHRYLVISLGTGLPEQDMKLDAWHVANWGIFGWLGGENTAPLLNMFLHASSDTTDAYVANLFKAIGSSNQLLRIQVCGPILQANAMVPFELFLYVKSYIIHLSLQEHGIPIEAMSVDLSTEENLQRLVEIGEELLHKPVSKNDSDGIEPDPEDSAVITYTDLLTRFAKLLSDERKLRLQNMELDAGHVTHEA